MKLLILGVTGMLGHKVYQVLTPEFDTIGTIRGHYSDISKYDFFQESRIIPNVNATESAHAREIIKDNTLPPEEADFITGCAVLAKRKTIENIGLLDERFFIYWEDTDWGLRVKKSGQKNLVVPQARIWHKVSVSIGGQESPRRIYLKTIGNRLPGPS